VRPLQLYNAIKQISPELNWNTYFYWLVIFAWQEFPESIARGDALPGSGVPPLYIDTSRNDVGVMLIVCNGQCPQRTLA
jgi:hypothetical protein